VAVGGWGGVGGGGGGGGGGGVGGVSISSDVMLNTRGKEKK